MKKSLLLLLLFVLSINYIQAQYKSLFGQNETQWLLEWSNLFESAQDTIYTVKDTSFAGKDWKEIICTPEHVHYPGGFLSEDTTTGRVWYKTKWDSTSPWSDTDTNTILAFDFSLQVGDTFNISYDWGATPDSLQVVDSVYQENGRTIIQFRGYTIHGERFKFIEGVGSNLGVIYKYTRGRMVGHYLLCAYKDGIQTYLNRNYGRCDVHDGSSTEKILKSSTSLYPNPTSGIFTVEIAEDVQLADICVYNALGEIVKKMPPSTMLDISDLAQGLYLIQLSTTDHHQTTLSIIKQ